MRFTSIGALFVVLSIVIFSTSCKKDEVVAEPTADPNPPINNTGPIGSGINLTTSIGGLVVDEFDTPVDNALITIGNQTTYTNENGQFYVTAISVDSERAYVKVEKTGYFLGARAFNPEANSIHSIKIKLLAKNAVGSFNNNSGGVVVSSGVSLTFEPRDISLQNGTPYNGAVTVFCLLSRPNFW
ncbi:carboxypeptidase-like regulatory domain-containing protein [Crocinitomicaceae bacterium]|nr:carboxypeptidase-like regulatory domain-containing protein [Crocinitomicaceae bacterium]